MNRLARFISERLVLSILILLAAALISAWLAGEAHRSLREAERLALLQADVGRRALEIMAQTLNGNLMGAVSVLGLLDPELKKEGQGRLAANGPKALEALGSIGRSYDADGVFVVPGNGVVGSSWATDGVSSTGRKVKFRPYFQMAMQGMNSIYAAVSLTRGERALFLAAPIYIDTTNGTDAVGAIVARTSLFGVDNLLRDLGDTALLLTPQSVVFASSRAEWFGHIAQEPTLERLRAIRELNQFGDLFDSQSPTRLAMPVETGVHQWDGQRFAVARAPVAWNDPFGDWSLVVAEDLSRTVPLAERLPIAGAAALMVLLLGAMAIAALRSHARQIDSSAALASLSHQQQEQAQIKENMSTATLLLQFAKTREDLAHTFLGEAHRLFHSLYGAVYLIDPADPATLQLAASFACPQEPPARIALGEGLLGQCAQTRQPAIVLRPDGRGPVRSGLGSAAPAALLLAPVLLKDELLGVFELACLTPPQAASQELLMEMSRLLGMNLEIVSRSATVQASLNATVTRRLEKRIVELKHEVNRLAESLGQPPVYESAALEALQTNAETFAEEFGAAEQSKRQENTDPEAVRRLIASLQQERIATLSLAEDAGRASADPSTTLGAKPEEPSP